MHWLYEGCRFRFYFFEFLFWIGQQGYAATRAIVRDQFCVTILHMGCADGHREFCRAAIVDSLAWTGADHDRFVDEWRRVHSPGLMTIVTDMSQACFIAAWDSLAL